jgi:hypothetical protein
MSTEHYTYWRDQAERAVMHEQPGSTASMLGVSLQESVARIAELEQQLAAKDRLLAQQHTSCEREQDENEATIARLKQEKQNALNSFMDAMKTAEARGMIIDELRTELAKSQVARDMTCGVLAQRDGDRQLIQQLIADKKALRQAGDALADAADINYMDVLTQSGGVKEWVGKLQLAQTAWREQRGMEAEHADV